MNGLLEESLTIGAAGRLKKLVVLDRIILLDDQWQRLRDMADELIERPRLSPDEMMRRLKQEADAIQAPMCWTQLAQEELSVRDLNEKIRDADGIITCWTNIPDEVILANPQLRYLGFWTNLVDHRVSLELARSRGIAVTYIPDYGTDSVAEMTITGILAVTRHLVPSVRDTKRGTWAYELLKAGNRVPSIEAIPQRMLRDKHLGILGFGEIGIRVAELALAFKMKVSYHSRTRRPEWEEKGVEYVEIDELFKRSDVLTVHLSPYAPARIITEARLQMLRDGAIFVNTSAGRLVDQDALWRQLRSGRINAYIDVYENLPPRKIIGELLHLNNIFTYRAAWFTQEAVTYKGERLLENLREYLAV
jgi:phosphoglycerate dehydrogenase-like enzyme